MIEAITSGVGSMIGFVGDVVEAFTATEGALAPLLGVIGLGIAASAVLFGIKVIRGLVWGM